MFQCALKEYIFDEIVKLESGIEKPNELHHLNINSLVYFLGTLINPKLFEN
jgi:hypothetical protein